MTPCEGAEDWWSLYPPGIAIMWIVNPTMRAGRGYDGAPTLQAYHDHRSDTPHLRERRVISPETEAAVQQVIRELNEGAGEDNF